MLTTILRKNIVNFYLSQTQSQIMETSRIITTIFLLISIASSTTSAASCDKNGQCKYGGVCGRNNQCNCQMDCMNNWEISFHSLYCLPKKGGYPEIFLNICYVMTRACELQQDIPLIKYDPSKSGFCPVKQAREERLCSKPEDFMGPCGGSIERRGQAYNAGVCLKNRRTGERRCECQQGHEGKSCDVKTVVYLATEKVQPPEVECVNNTRNIIGVSIGATVGAGVLLVFIIYALIRCRRSSCTECNGKCYKFTNSEVGEHTNNRVDGEFTSCRKSAVEYTAIAISGSEEKTALTSKDNQNLVEKKCSPKRQRLTGMSEHHNGDRNNNFGNQQEEKADTWPLRHSEEMQSNADTGFKAPISRGLSRGECLNNTARTTL